LFFAVDYDTEVKPLDRFVTEERPARAGLTAGEHLFAQTAQSFNYQKARLASGEITLPETYVPLSSFGQGANTRARTQGNDWPAQGRNLRAGIVLRPPGALMTRLSVEPRLSRGTS